MNVTVATRNPIKVEAVRAVFERFHPGSEAVVHGVDLAIDTPEQPMGPEIEAGAIARAKAAADQEGADLGIGIEAGLMQLPGTARWISIQVCAIADRGGRVSTGLGPGYELPAAIRDAVLLGEPLREAFCRILDVSDADRRGAIFHLSGGLIDRLALTEQAVRMAFISLMASQESPLGDVPAR